MVDLVSVSRDLDAWIEREGFAGWDPFDALNSPLLKRLTFGQRRIGQVWVQLLKRSPVNPRLLLGVPRGHNPKGMGLFLASYWRKYLTGAQTADRSRAEWLLDWLDAHTSRGYSGACWGYNFDWPNRGFFAPAYTPTIVGTAFIGFGLLDVCTLGPDDRDRPLATRALQLARSSCDFILRDLRRDTVSPGEWCFSYTPLDTRYVHNASLVGGWLLARVGAISGEQDLLDAAHAVGCYTARRQQPDGSWRYGEGNTDGWADSYHTAYVLSALDDIGRRLGTGEFEPAVARGYEFWRTRFFTPTGSPIDYPDRAFPVDIHSASQAILTSCDFRGRDEDALRRARDVANWACEHMRDPDGYFYFQRHRYYTNRVPYMRWSQAWMQRALTELAWVSQA